MAFTFIIAGIVVGGCVVYALTIVAVLRFRSEISLSASTAAPPIGVSILKAVHGNEPELEQNLRSFFEINYPAYELLFAAREDHDPALSVARELSRQYPNVPTKILVTGEPPCPNAKVFSLGKMAAVAQHDLFVISDSDIRADQNYLANIAAEFADPRVGVVTCPYRAVPGASFWSLLEALGMNSEFWGGVVLAQMLAPMGLAVGPVVPTREWRELYAALDCAVVGAIHPFYTARMRVFQQAGPSLDPPPSASREPAAGSSGLARRPALHPKKSRLPKRLSCRALLQRLPAPQSRARSP